MTDTHFGIGGKTAAEVLDAYPIKIVSTRPGFTTSRARFWHVVTDPDGTLWFEPVRRRGRRATLGELTIDQPDNGAEDSDAHGDRQHGPADGGPRNL